LLDPDLTCTTMYERTTRLGLKHFYTKNVIVFLGFESFFPIIQINSQN